VKRFLKKYKTGHIWLLCLAAFFALYFSCRSSRMLMNALCSRIVLPYEQWLGHLCGLTDISVAEVLILTASCAAFFYLTWVLRRLITGPNRGEVFYRFLLIVACGGLTIWALFCLLWGTFYNTDSFQERSSLTARGGTVEELAELTTYFAAELSNCADEVQRNDMGLYDEPRDAIFAAAPEAYSMLYGEFPFLDTPQSPPKAFAASRALSAINFTGFYFPLTGETNLNVDAPSALLAGTICHELAHQRGIASEQECNFLGILAATRSDSAACRYSGYLMGYIYLGNALSRTDHEAWKTVWDSLPETVIADLRANNAYWAQFEKPVKQVAQRVYNGFLIANGDPNGIRSYGMVVDLLLGYYMG